MLPHPLVITPLTVGLLCMALITGGTLHTTPPYKSTPSDDIFKGQKVITGVCFRPCYTAYTYVVPPGGQGVSSGVGEITCIRFLALAGPARTIVFVIALLVWVV